LAGAREASPDATVAGGGVSMAAGVEAIASSRGVAAMDQATRLDAGASVILSWGDGDGTAATWDSRGTHTGELDARAVGRTAADKAVRLADPQPFSSGKRDVLFAPDAFGELLHGIVVGALMGDDVSRSRSVWADRMGDRVAHGGLSLWDDPRHAKGLGTTASDDEGLATRRLPLLEAGRVATFLYDSWDAHEHGAAASPCALRGSFKALPRAGTHHLVLEHANTRPADDLVADVEQGLLVDSILGAHTANPTTGDFSVTAPNAWLIEGGQIVGAAQESAIAGNLPRLLEGLDAVGDDARPAGGGLLPTVRLRDVGVAV
ncbi:MAG: TldD/PmbA family protein, partial [Thermoplasmatota archaeon]